jgi:hypothetical protein
LYFEILKMQFFGNDMVGLLHVISSTTQMNLNLKESVEKIVVLDACLHKDVLILLGLIIMVVLAG